MVARRIGISYARFSDPNQADGDSIERQEKAFRGFCTRHNLTPLSQGYADRGMSGFKGRHREKGELGQLIAAAEAGAFEKGSIIVVEAWDRLGRMIPNKQIKLIEELLVTGIHIGICRLDDVFTMEDFGTHKWAILSTFVMLAYQESKQKADRVASSWAARRSRAKENGAIMTGLKPAWLEIVNGTFRPVPEAVAVVRRIFELSAAGNGHARIIRALDADGIASLGSKDLWSHGYIRKVLTDRRVLGELKLKDGTVLPTYYPRVIEDDLYNLARSGQVTRRKKGQRDRQHVNTFQDLFKNALDGEGFYLHNRATAGKPQLYLYNVSAARGRGRHTGIPYHVFEEAILGKLTEIKPDDVLSKEQGASKADVLRAKLKNIRADITGLQADLKEGYSKGLAAVLRDKEQEEERIAGLLQDELARTVRPAERAWEQLPGLIDLIRRHGDEARLKIRPVLRSLVLDARLLLLRRDPWTLAAVQFFFHGGAVRQYLLTYRQASRSRPAAWGLLDFKRTGQKPLPAVPDLRDPEQARRFAERLQALDLSD